MSKKSQAILPFFAVQLVCMMVFMIVLLSLLTMTKNVKFTINEFDENTAFLLAGRRLLSSADCFASEDREIFYDNESNRIYTGTRIFPNVLDYNKLLDYENFNCIRKDFYDREADVLSGYWDAANATGAVFSYRIKVVDLKTGESVYDSAVSNDFATSLVGRINKTEEGSTGVVAGTDRCGVRYGSGWWISGTTFGGGCSDNSFKSCTSGRCVVGGISNTSEVKPYWNILDSGVGGNKCIYVFNDTKVSNFSDDNVTAMTYKDLTNSNPNPNPIWANITWTQFDTTCESINGSRSMIIPTMLKIDNELHPAVMYLQTCLIRGQKHEGLTLLEINYEPKTGGQGCV